jgi:hypothetical protein
VFTEPFPSNDRKKHIQTQRELGNLISLFYFPPNTERRLIIRTSLNSEYNDCDDDDEADDNREDNYGEK